MKFSLKKEDKKIKNKIEEPIVATIVEKIEVIEEPMNVWDYVRVVNVRGEPEYQAQKGEKVIVANRDNPVLGNPFVMKNQTIEERDRVVTEHEKHTQKDISTKGPIWSALYGIAQDIVENKQKVAFECWCFPLKCHTENYLPVVVNMAQDILENKSVSENNTKTVKMKI